MADEKEIQEQEERAARSTDEPGKENHAEDAALEEDEEGENLPVPRGLEVVAATEALLFAASQPFNRKRLSVLMNGVPEEEVDQALGVLRNRYDHAGSGLMLMEVAGGWQLATRPEVADWVLRLHKHRRRNPLTPALLETLSIIAYKQPMTRADVEAIRGVDCGTGLRSLQDAGLVEVIGRKDVIGRPPLYGTTELFLKVFGLNNLEDLPVLHGEKPSLPQPEEDSETEEKGQKEIPTDEVVAEDMGEEE